MKFLVWGGMMMGLLLVAYFLGKAHANQKIAYQQVEVMRDAKQKKNQIYSQPNISRNRALQLFERGVL